MAEPITVGTNTPIDNCLFDLIVYVPVNNFSVMLGWVFQG